MSKLNNSSLSELYVIDLKGDKITVTNLEQAIEQADQFKSYRHKSNYFSKLDKELNAYWTDMYNKLTALKEQ